MSFISRMTISQEFQLTQNHKYQEGLLTTIKIHKILQVLEVNNQLIANKFNSQILGHKIRTIIMQLLLHQNILIMILCIQIMSQIV